MDFEEIYDLYAPKVFRVCMGYVNDHDHANDLTQETFISVWQNLSSFRGESNINTWIFRIATNNCLRALEKSKRRSAFKLPVDTGPEDGHEIQDQQLEFVYQCIAELKEIDRIIISLALEDLPQSEIAAVVGLSHANIRVKIHRIKDHIAQKFKDHGRFN
jgi:RNA polymerase sigma-70 factor, ECF subfamily